MLDAHSDKEQSQIHVIYWYNPSSGSSGRAVSKSLLCQETPFLSVGQFALPTQQHCLERCLLIPHSLECWSLVTGKLCMHWGELVPCYRNTVHALRGALLSLQPSWAAERGSYFPSCLSGADWHKLLPYIARLATKPEQNDSAEVVRKSFLLLFIMCSLVLLITCGIFFFFSHLALLFL